MNNLLVSVIVPTFNRSHSILKTICSIMNQSYKNYEIIVVDDGSTDNTVKILERFKDSIVVLTQENKGPAAAKNMGLKYAKGYFIAPLDSDDVWNSDYLENGVHELISGNHDLYISNWTQSIYTPSTVTYSQSHHPKNTLYITDFSLFKEYIFKDNLGANSGMIFKKSILKNGWNEKINIGDDWYLLIELSLSNPHLRIGYCSTPIWVKNRFHDNICDGNKGEQFRKKHLDDIEKILYDFADKLNIKQVEKLYIKKVQNILLLSLYNISNLKRLNFDSKRISRFKILQKAIFEGFFRFRRKYF